MHYMWLNVFSSVLRAFTVTAAVAAGAAARGNDVNDEATVALVGGLVTSGMFSMVKKCLPSSCDLAEEFAINHCMLMGVLIELMVALGVLLTGPLIGEEILHAGTKWNVTVTDGFSGATMLFMLASSLGCCICLCASTTGMVVYDCELGLNPVVVRRGGERPLPPVADADSIPDAVAEVADAVIAVVVEPAEAAAEVAQEPVRIAMPLQ